MDLIGLLIWLIIAAIIAGLIIYLVRLLPIPAPWGRIIEVAIIIVVILILLQKLVGIVPVG